jgi:hypothetical protein
MAVQLEPVRSRGDPSSAWVARIELLDQRSGSVIEHSLGASHPSRHPDDRSVGGECILVSPRLKHDDRMMDPYGHCGGRGRVRVGDRQAGCKAGQCGHRTSLSSMMEVDKISTRTVLVLVQYRYGILAQREGVSVEVSLFQSFKHSLLTAFAETRLRKHGRTNRA